MTEELTPESDSSEVPPPVAPVQLVTFEVNQQLFGIEVTTVQEVIKFNSITPTPGASEIIEGVIDLRGNIVPVIDLRKRFRLASAENQTGSKIIIAEVKEYIFGFIVDKVNEVHTFPISEFAPPPPGVSAPGSEYTVGMAHLGERLLLFLDIEQVLDVERLLGEAL